MYTRVYKGVFSLGAYSIQKDKKGEPE